MENVMTVTISKGASISGTCLQGQIVTTYDELVKVFGEPDFGPDDFSGDKITCEWCLEFDDGEDIVVATIYDWKYGETPYHKTEWNIGGKSYEAVDAVYKAMGKL